MPYTTAAPAELDRIERQLAAALNNRITKTGTWRSTIEPIHPSPTYAELERLTSPRWPQDAPKETE